MICNSICRHLIARRLQIMHLINPTPTALVVSSLLISGLLIQGCASNPTEQESAWKTYERFRVALEENGLDTDYAPFFSAHAYQDIREASKEDRPYIKEMLAYPRYFSVTFEHYEKSIASGACLTLNGETLHGDIGSLSIELLEEDGRLKMNDANLLYVDSKADFIAQAKCPDETRI